MIKSGWGKARLGEVVKFIGGSQPPKSSFIGEERDGYIRLLQIRDYKTDSYKSYIQRDQARRFCSKDDIMIGRYGPPIFQILRGLEGAYNVALLKAEPSPKVTKDYLYYFLKQRTLFNFIERLSQRTAGQSGVDMDGLKNYPILIPPLSQQKLISAILDKADAIRRKRKEAIKLYDEFLRATFLDMFGDPIINSKKWEKRRLGDLTIKIGSGATPRGGKSAYVAQGISLIRSLNIHDDKFMYKELAHITDKQADGLSSVVVEDSDVLLNITGASVCRCAIVPDDVLPARVNQRVCIIRSKKTILNSQYLLHCLISKNYRQKLLSIAGAGGATREALTKQQVEHIEIPVPPLELQNKYTSIKNSMLNIKNKHSIFFERPLFKSLAQRAFRGEL